MSQAAACMALKAVLRLAGLAKEPDVRPGSVRHWAGRSLYDAGLPIHEVALALGHRSLDETAADIGLRWREGFAYQQRPGLPTWSALPSRHAYAQSLDGR